ncbi:AzlD domain-containing protein [Chitinibacteraceae bacterium HSL-7]
MSHFEFWLGLVGMGALTYATRALFIVPGARVRFPLWAHRALRFVPVAVLTALITPMAVAPGGDIWLDWRNPSLAGLIAAMAYGYLRRNVLVALALGFAVFALWRWLVV